MLKLTFRPNYWTLIRRIKTYINLEKIFILEAKLYVSTYKRSPKLKEITLESFLDGVRRTLSGLVEHMLEFLNFNKFTDRLDTFYAKLYIAEYIALWKIFVIILSVFHGQPSVERGFNTNADMVDHNQSDHSLMALRMAHDHMRSYEVGPRDMKINKERRQSRGKSR